jgi:hypothetical protein
MLTGSQKNSLGMLGGGAVQVIKERESRAVSKIYREHSSHP